MKYKLRKIKYVRINLVYCEFYNKIKIKYYSLITRKRKKIIIVKLRMIMIIVMMFFILFLILV